jgi:hypothetical protein
MMDISDNVLCALVTVCATILLAISIWRSNPRR